MPKLIEKPVSFRDNAVQGEEIKEFVGRISTGTEKISIGLLTFPEGWSEPPQTPEFDEYSVVLEGNLYVDTESAGTVIVRAGRGILTPKGERIQYRTPEPDGAFYLSVCLPAFSPELAHREHENTEIRKTEKPSLKCGGKIVVCRRPTYLQGTGLNSKMVEEFFGVLNSNSTELSIAKVVSQERYMEDFHRVDYDKYYFVLKGELQVIDEESGLTFHVGPTQGILVHRGESTRYGSPKLGGSEYIVVCVPPRNLDFDSREILTDIDKLHLTE